MAAESRRSGLLCCTLKKQAQEQTFGFHFVRSPRSDCLVVERVQDDSPATRAGLRIGDVLIAFDGESVIGKMPEDAGKIGERAQNGRLTVTYTRDEADERLLSVQKPHFISIYHLKKWKNCPGFGFAIKNDSKMITKISEKSPAFAAGMRENDFLCHVNSVNVRNTDITAVFQEIASSGDEVTLTVAPRETLTWLANTGKTLDQAMPELYVQKYSPPLEPSDHCNEKFDENESGEPAVPPALAIGPSKPESFDAGNRNIDWAPAEQRWQTESLSSMLEDEKRMIQKAIEVEAESYEMPFCCESFYILSGLESEFFQLIVTSLPNISILQFIEDLIKSNQSLITEQTKNGCTLLHIFILHKLKNLTELMLTCGAKILQKDSMGRLPLHFAAASNNPEAISALVGTWQAHVPLKPVLGPPWLSSPDMSGYTAIHYGVENMALKAVRRLVELGANVASQDDHGQTALHVAVKQVDDDSLDLPRICLNQIIEVLLTASIERKLNPPLWEIVQEDGLTPCDLAKKGGFTLTAMFIEKKIQELVSKIPSAPPMTASLMIHLASSNPDSASRTLNECCICATNEIDCLLEPCSHLTVCSECVCQIKDCPICRAPIKSTKKVYLS